MVGRRFRPYGRFGVNTRDFGRGLFVSDKENLVVVAGSIAEDTLVLEKMEDQRIGQKQGLAITVKKLGIRKIGAQSCMERPTTLTWPMH